MHPDDQTTSGLIRTAHQMAPERLAWLLESYRELLRSTARGRIRRGAVGHLDASDAAQETIIKANLRFGQFRGKTKWELASWLKGILSRCMADEARCKSLERARTAPGVLGNDVGASDYAKPWTHARANTNSPSQDALQQESTATLAVALAKLSATDRQVVILRGLEERRWSEVARLMGRTEGSVRLLWTRALKKLHPLIEAKS